MAAGEREPGLHEDGRSPLAEEVSGRFVPVRRLGRGATGEVWLAEDREGSRTVALKLAGRAGAGTDDETRALARRQLRREFAVLSELRHPCVPEVGPCGRSEDSGAEWFALEHVEGRGLQESLRGASDERIAATLSEVLSTLAFVHSRSRVHGDLKPENLLVRAPDPIAGGRVVLLDFGLAIDPAEEHDDHVRGTPRYLAPAVLAGARASAQSDLFALGKTFQEAIGRASSLDPFLERLVSVDPNQSFASASAARADLERRTGVTAPPIPIPAAHFVGRERELGALREVLDGDGRAALVSGPAGIGKSRLLERAVSGLGFEGFECVRVAVHEDLEALPLARLLRSVALRVERADTRLAQALAEAADELRALGPVSSSAELQWGERLAELLDAAAEFLQLVFVVEDVHDLPPDERGIWWRLLDRDAPYVWFLSSRRSRAELGLDEEGVRELTLEPLPSGETACLASSMFVSENARRIAARRVAELTGGHPHYAEAAARRVALALAGESTAEVSELVYSALPETYHDALLAEQELLEEEDRELLSVFSLFEFPVSSSFVADVLGRAPRAIATRADSLRGIGILESVGARTAEPRLAFRSDVVRRLVRAGLEGDAARLHARILGCWERHLGPPDERPATYWRHLSGAGEHARALEFGCRALERIVARRQGIEAQRLCDELAALDGAERAPWSWRLAEFRGDALLTVADRERGVASFGEAEALARGSAAPRDLKRILTKRGAALFELGRPDEARAVLSEARGCDGDARDEARALAVLARIVHTEGDPTGARALLRAGLEALRAEPDSIQASELWNDLGVVAFLESELSEARGHHEKALAIRGALDDVDGVSRSLTNLANIAVVRGRVGEAALRFRRALEMKRRLRNLGSISATLSNLAYLDEVSGDFAEAFRRLEEVDRLRTRARDVPGLHANQVRLAGAWLVKGRFDRAAAHLRRAGELVSEARLPAAADVSRALVEARLAGEVGRADEALRVLTEARERCRAARLGRQLPQVALAGACIHAELRCDPEAADAWRADEPAEFDSLRNALLAMELEVRSAELEFACGRSERALQWVRSGLARVHEVKAPVHEARLELIAGAVALEQGQLSRASELLHGALNLTARLGLPELDWRVRERLGDLHWAQGNEARATAWWKECVDAFRRGLDELGDERLEEDFLAAVPRARVLEKLQRVL